MELDCKLQMGDLVLRDPGALCFVFQRKGSHSRIHQLPFEFLLHWREEEHKPTELLTHLSSPPAEED